MSSESDPAAVGGVDGGAAASVMSPLPLSIGDLSTAERSAIYQYYVGIFGGLCVLLLLIRKCFGVGVASKSRPAAVLSPEFLRFQRSYVLVYLIMMAADWLQGPYVYALYKFYNYAISDIGVLFIAGFGSSMVVGTLVGSAADKYGRKKLCLVFGLVYSISCLTKHVKSFPVLLFGRLLGGVSTSILFSSFESWMVAEHHAAKYPDEWLGLTFSLCTTGNGVVAIGSGVVAGVVREAWGPVAPFDVSLLCLVVGSVIIALTWRENTGDATIDLKNTLNNAWVKLKQDNKIIYLGVIQSFFEGAMYIFVFMWTPALEATSPWTNQLISHGWIFACFMICVLIGSSLFQYFLEHSYRVERTTLYMIVVACCSLLLPAFVEVHSVRFVSFCAFETCVGLFWPSLGYLRSKYVPEDCRATTMNFFRMPLNLIVVMVLANIGSLTTFQVFMLCVLVLLPAMACQLALLRVVERTAGAGEAATSPGGGPGARDGKGGADQIPLVRKEPPRSASNPTRLNGTTVTPRRTPGSNTPTPKMNWPADSRPFVTSP